ncbi:MAG TPA: hypothetical protein VKT70_04510 [Stellaceae bacterium]|nr:hypothetical protein [Stellaceae bacterium]
MIDKSGIKRWRRGGQVGSPPFGSLLRRRFGVAFPRTLKMIQLVFILLVKKPSVPGANGRRQRCRSGERGQGRGGDPASIGGEISVRSVLAGWGVTANPAPDHARHEGKVDRLPDGFHGFFFKMRVKERACLAFKGKPQDLDGECPCPGGSRCQRFRDAIGKVLLACREEGVLHRRADRLPGRGEIFPIDDVEITPPDQAVFLHEIDDDDLGRWLESGEGSENGLDIVGQIFGEI